MNNYWPLFCLVKLPRPELPSWAVVRPWRSQLLLRAALILFFSVILLGLVASFLISKATGYLYIVLDNPRAWEYWVSPNFSLVLVHIFIMFISAIVFTGLGIYFSSHFVAWLNTQQDNRREQFASLAHDARGPLCALKGYLETLSDAQLPKYKEAQFLESCRKLVKVVEGLLDQLFDRAKFDSVNQSLHDSEVSIGELYTAVIQRFNQKLQDKNMTHHFFCGMPEKVLRVDRSMLERALANIIDNAIKYSPPRTVVTFTARLKKEWIEFSIADTGKGIPEKHLPYIFDRYYRVQTEQHSGSGLGLGIVQQIMQAHGGLAYIESTDGVGTTVRLLIPVARVAKK